MARSSENRTSGGRSAKREKGGVSRRGFLGGAAAAAACTVVPRSVLGGPEHVAPSERTTLGCIGTGGQGLQNLQALIQYPEMQAVAVCDVVREGPGYLSWNWARGDEQRTGGREPARRIVDEHYGKQKPSGEYRGCRAYEDYRELLDKEDVDAVMIATPDHTHAVITMAALNKGKHVYCEKPLTWSVHEARLVAETARKAGVATQLGNHGQASEEARIVQEFLLDNAIGPVHEIKTCYGTRFWKWPRKSEGRPDGSPPVPEWLNWDLWLGPAPQRPYHPEYCPWTWRNWWDFGTGLLGDIWCHWLSTPFKALKLTHPISVEASSTKIDSDIYPLGVIARFEFPAREGMPPLKITWYDGGLKPETPKELEPGRRMGGVTYFGEKGILMGHRLIPETEMRKYGRPPRVLPRSVGHYKEWVDACRGGPPAGANFDHAGPLTEACLLANVALRAGKKLTWDGPNFKITNDEAANKLLHREYREGWSL